MKIDLAEEGEATAEVGLALEVAAGPGLAAALEAGVVAGPIEAAGVEAGQGLDLKRGHGRGHVQKKDLGQGLNQGQSLQMAKVIMTRMNHDHKIANTYIHTYIILSIDVLNEGRPFCQL